jgi:sugar/nucleoside kinase (ribokinase family)
MFNQGKLLCVGNFALDKSILGTNTTFVLGGAGFRFVSAWALFRLKMETMAVVGPDVGWADATAMLNENNIGTSMILHAPYSLEFTTEYNLLGDIVSFGVKHEFLMDILVDHVLGADLTSFDLVHICPFVCDAHYSLVEKARSEARAVSTMIHYSSLSTTTRKQYLELIRNVDFLFLNSEEAQFLVDGSEDWKHNGDQISQLFDGLMFLTLGNEGAAVFRSGELLYWVPAANLVVRDSLGAGDCFAGGALAGLAISGNELVALRCGAMAASFALADKGHESLLRFLMFEEHTHGLS